MPYNGGLTSSPERYGGGIPRLKRILDALNAEMGSAFDTSSPSSVVYQENLARAKCINAVYEASQRLANQWDPQRMTDFLPRWEAILKLAVSPSDSLTTRRARVAAIFAQTGQIGNRAFVLGLLMPALGANLVSLAYIAPGSALTYWPGGTPGPAPYAWYSTISHLLINVQRLTNQTEAQFLAVMGTIGPLLDGVLPAWVTWDWITQPNGFSGSSATGFVLSGTNSDGYAKNINNEAFDV